MSIKGYVDEVLASCDTTGVASTPATDVCLKCAKEQIWQRSPRWVHFHSMVAKLLYLAKKARSDFLLILSYLASRVSRCNKDDLATGGCC
jgi:hypothetical protein